jgi:RimK family alpha-L-glutamate ligase
MTGVLLYHSKDVEKNLGFIKKFISFAQEWNVNVEVWTYENLKNNELRSTTDRHILSAIDFVVNRSREYDIAAKFERLGIRVFNSSAVSLLCNDKDFTYQWAKQQGIAVLDYQIAEPGLTSNYGYPCVLKSCSGHGGNEVFLCHTPAELTKFQQRLAHKKSIIQRLAKNNGIDTRIYVIGSEIIVAMERKSNNGFTSNYSLGGQAQPVHLDKRSRDLVKQLIKTAKFDFVGIDLIRHQEQLQLNEIEDAVGSRMVYENTDIDIIKRYVAYIYNTIVKELSGN